jgi:hypothetical protein
MVLLIHRCVLVYNAVASGSNNCFTTVVMLKLTGTEMCLRLMVKIVVKAHANRFAADSSVNSTDELPKKCE